jgi:eukaryotic-like serine/threonine-protein kinase
MNALLEALGPHCHESPPQAPGNAVPPVVQSAGGPPSRSSGVARAATGATMPSGQRLWWVIGAAGLAMVAMGTWGISRRNATRAQAATSVVASTESATGPAAPSCASLQATAALQESIQAFHDGNPDVFLASGIRAAEVDPTCAASHLRLAMRLRVSDSSKAPEHYQKAMLHRATLTPRDRALLEASEPYFRQPWDLGEFERRLAHPADPSYADADWYYYLSLARALQFNEAGTRDALDQALSRMPGHVPALLKRGEVQMVMGDLAGMLRSMDQCLSAAPAATLCLSQRIAAARLAGECDRTRKDAEALVAAQPASPSAHRALAGALFAGGSSLDGVDEALRRSVQLLRDPSDRAAADFSRQIAMATIGGRLGEAETVARKWLESVDASPEADKHLDPAVALIDLLQEMGKTKEAADLADGLTRRIDAWTRAPHALDSRLLLVEARYRGGRITAAEFGEQVDAWVRKVQDKPSLFGSDPSTLAWFLWSHRVSVARTPEEARRVLEQAPQGSFPYMRAGYEMSSAAGDAGRVYVLAGRATDAVPLLRIATRECPSPDSVALRTRSQLYLGMALEATGDSDGARKVYEQVLERWGNAQPRSVTAAQARKRLATVKGAH